MLKNLWYVVLDSKEVKNNKPIRVKRFNKELIFWRNIKKEIVCFDNLCEHGKIAINLNKTKDNCTYCSFHGFEFNDIDECFFIPLNIKDYSILNKHKTNLYHVKEFHGFIWFWYGDEKEKNDEINFFNTIDSFSSYGKTYKEVFNTNFIKCIENKLNVSYLPFINEKTLKKEKKSLLNDILVELDKETIKIWIDNKKRIKSQINTKNLTYLKNNEPDVEFIFPNILKLKISQTFYCFIAFSPESQEETILYIRFYQKIISVKLLKAFFKVIDDFCSIKKLRQDKLIIEDYLTNNSFIEKYESLSDPNLAIVYFREIMKNGIFDKIDNF
ncbi:MAG: Rieske 2Fe-2S domain-containing protein [Cyanobacteriota bacterium]